MSLFAKKKEPEQVKLRPFAGQHVKASLNFDCDVSLIRDLRRIADEEGTTVEKAALAVLYKALGYIE